MIGIETLRAGKEQKRLRRMKRLKDYYFRLGREKKYTAEVLDVKLNWFQKLIQWLKNLFIKIERN